MTAPGRLLQYTRPAHDGTRYVLIKTTLLVPDHSGDMSWNRGALADTTSPG